MDLFCADRPHNVGNLYLILWFCRACRGSQAPRGVGRAGLESVTVGQ